MVNCFRFMNSDVFFDYKSLTVLLRVLEASSVEEREKWWTDVRACRRRRQIAPNASMPVSVVFNTTTEGGWQQLARHLFLPDPAGGGSADNYFSQKALEQCAANDGNCVYK